MVKGVLSEEEAVKCADLGAKAIIVSHHHGRLPYAVPPLMVLPSIKKALEGRDVKIFVDCGIASGADVWKKTRRKLSCPRNTNIKDDGMIRVT